MRSERKEERGMRKERGSRHALRLNNGETRSPIYCDDCGREKMAEVRDGKLVIIDRRHGRRHVAVVPLGDLRST